MPQFDEHGREIPDPRPIAATVKTHSPPSIDDRVRAILRSEQLRRAAAAEGYETPEEAEDFDVPDDDTIDPTTPYEIDFDHLSDEPRPPQDGAMAQEEPITQTPPQSPPNGGEAESSAHESEVDRLIAQMQQQLQILQALKGTDNP